MSYCKGPRNDNFALEGQKKYFLTTIHSPPVAPVWVADDNSASESDVARNESDVVRRMVKVRGH